MKTSLLIICLSLTFCSSQMLREDQNVQQLRCVILSNPDRRCCRAFRAVVSHCSQTTELSDWVQQTICYQHNRRCSTCNEIGNILWNLKVYHPAYNRPPLVPILSQTNRFHHPLPFCFFTVLPHIWSPSPSGLYQQINRTCDHYWSTSSCFQP